ncbi:UDP-N-acetylglucosamine 2-epimerase (non-hydrolyzing) [Methanobacterium sp. CWC-01]|uniref:non-hydrolyzing UDP-N-acetylglucosamine 2-epimerase n=1 Tax=Methanobacterium aridiramus TaxID=2584467 RepID=UPI002574F710|nr:UDP-N-acetylglucosamine 2-epimerase (non-hydrolyzing) [Methanobacterium sp. CWC-01]WJI08880.1 UDP-N-acetylglucosamine 2-epimerase (non-hydrolyzing) [Methanobacterium sp. CWC-01]
MKIAFVIGTRPEIIKMSPLIDEVKHRGIDYILVHTGQHYDHEMSQQFFMDLDLEKPHYNIGVGSGAHGEQTSMMISRIEEVLLEEKPDIVLVEGDTNAVLAGALVAAKLHIPVGHVEAGLRSYDKTMPEEINRMVADVCTQLFFVPTNTAATNLLFEGVNPKNIFITGNTVVDACQRNLKIARKNSDLALKIDSGAKVLTLTLHRAENVDHPQRLGQIVNSLLELEDLTIIFPVHPRTTKNLQEFGLYEKLEEAPHIQIIKPMGYLEFLLLLSESQMVMTDSGGIQEEAITLNLPCITLRYNTERPETVQAGGNILVGTSQEKIVNSVRNILGDEDLYHTMKEAPNPYGDGNASIKIVDTISEIESHGGLKIEAPDFITGVNTTKLIRVDQIINVSEFEDKYQAIVKIVFEDGEPIFPEPELNLGGKMVLMSGKGL